MSRPLFRRLLPPPLPQQVEDELRFHLDMRIAEYQAQGMSESAARERAEQRMGNLPGAREECLTVGRAQQQARVRGEFFSELLQDVRFAWRGLRRQKGWTAVVLITLALGIGASTAVFSVVNSLLLHAVPYPGGNRVVLLFETTGGTGDNGITIGPFPDAVRAWRASSKSFEQVEPFKIGDMTLRSDAEPAVAHTVSVTSTFASFAGTHPILGRNFSREDVGPGATKVAMLGESMWRTRYGSDPAILGRSITLDSNTFTVIGVAPRDLKVIAFGTPTAADVWLPLSLDNEKSNMLAMGRLRPGIELSVAARELDTLASRALPKTGRDFRTQLQRPGDLVDFRSSLLLLSGAVALVLLVACANVAHLLLGRGASRARELAIRTTLGASRGRLFRQLLTESLMLAASGCIAGIILGWFALRALLGVRPEPLQTLDATRIDIVVLLVAVGVSLLFGILFGVTGMFQAGGKSPQESLKSGSLSSTGTAAHRRLRGGLVITELALSVMLLVGAMLLVRTMAQLVGRDLGFNPRGVYAMEIPRGNTAAAGSNSLMTELLARAPHLPGVVDVTVASGAPPRSGGMVGAFVSEEHLTATPLPFMRFNAVRSDYFHFLGLRFVEGGTFTDTTAAAEQAVINQGLAHTLWPGESAVGRRFRGNDKAPWMVVVGVLADASTAGATSEASAPMVYTAGPDENGFSLLVRVTEGSNPMPAMRGLLASIDRSLPPPTMLSVADTMNDMLASPRFTMLLLSIFTLVALLLAAIGLYGVMSYSVALRTREIGIRMALGATERDIVSDVVRTGFLLAGSGLVIGVLASLWATRLLSRMLYGLSPTDPFSFAAGVVILLATALLASLIPARRAVQIDPLVAIRTE